MDIPTLMSFSTCGQRKSSKPDQTDCYADQGAASGPPFSFSNRSDLNCAHFAKENMVKTDHGSVSGPQTGNSGRGTIAHGRDQEKPHIPNE